jgi:small GTP-binding protein
LYYAGKGPDVCLVVLGAAGTGKSSMSLHFVQGYFKEQYVPTLEDYYNKDVNVDGKMYKVEILDTAGSELFEAASDQYITKGNAFLIVYSIADKNSFNVVKDLRDKVVEAHGESAPIIIAANKCDLIEKRAISTGEGETLAQNLKAKFFETSAKTNINIDKVFVELTTDVVKPVASDHDDKKKKKRTSSRKNPKDMVNSASTATLQPGISNATMTPGGPSTSTLHPTGPRRSSTTAKLSPGMSSAVTSKNFQSGDKVDCRIVVLGAAGAGKSSLSKVFITGEFPKNYIPTLSDTLTKQVEFHKETITVEILDTAGSEQFEDVRDMYMKYGDAFVLVYSVAERYTFDKVKDIRDKILAVKGVDQIDNEEDGPIMAMVGNKIDLVDTRLITTDEGENLAKQLKCRFIETSAKQLINVDKVFEPLIERVMMTKVGGGKKGDKKCVVM